MLVPTVRTAYEKVVYCGFAANPLFISGVTNGGTENVTSETIETEVHELSAGNLAHKQKKTLK